MSMKNSADLTDLVAGYREYAEADEFAADAQAPAWVWEYGWKRWIRNTGMGATFAYGC